MKLSEKRVFVTGACGTVGHELIRQLLTDYKVKELVAIDTNESALLFLEQEFKDFPQAQFYLGDVRHGPELTRRMKGAEVVFHTAALKHVLACEKAPNEAIQTNILGMQNMIHAATHNDVERLVFTSSDKAVNPTSVMGSTKLTGERLLTAASYEVQKTGGPIFSSVRFGNILGSRGSVIPIFKEQIRQGGPITLTDNAMTRFIMDLKQAVKLVIDSVFHAQGGEIFVTRMPAIKIQDLAEVMRDALSEQNGHKPDDIKIETIGAKPGEKLDEELMTSEESRRALMLDNYYVILPAFAPAKDKMQEKYAGAQPIAQNTTGYTSGSEDYLSQQDLFGFLMKNNLLQDDQTDNKPSKERAWPKVA